MAGSPTTSDRELVAALREGDDAAFERLVRAHGAAMQRVARTYVHDDAVAAEVVQDTWLAVLEGLARFEGASSLRTWVFTILVNRARTRHRREARSVPMSALGDEGPTVDPERFLPPDHPEWPGHWASPPRRWDPEQRMETVETLRCIDEAVRALPEAQAQVMVLRDVAGFSSDEVCAMLELGAGNQRVLLHRARARVRAALEKRFGGEP